MAGCPRRSTLPAAVPVLRRFGVTALSGLGLALGLLASPDGARAAAFMYGIDASGNVIEYDPETKAAPVTVGSFGAVGSPGNAIGFDGSNGRDRIWSYDQTYGIRYYDRATQFVSSTIVSVSEVKALVGIAPAAATVPNFADAAFHNGSFWFVNTQLISGNNYRRLVRVNFTYSGNTPTYAPYSASDPSSTTAAWTWPTNFPTQSYGDIAITTAGQLYGATALAGGVANTAAFYKVDLAGLSGSDPSAPTAVPDAAYSLIKSTGNPSLQIAFDSSFNALYGVENTTGTWYTFDKNGGGEFNGNLTAISGYTTTGIRDLAGSATTSATTAAPGPLPLLGTAAAYRASRRLRRRLDRALC